MLYRVMNSNVTMAVSSSELFSFFGITPAMHKSMNIVFVITMAPSVLQESS